MSIFHIKPKPHHFSNPVLLIWRQRQLSCTEGRECRKLHSACGKLSSTAGCELLKTTYCFRAEEEHCCDSQCPQSDCYEVEEFTFICIGINRLIMFIAEMTRLRYMVNIHIDLCGMAQSLSWLKVEHVVYWYSFKSIDSFKVTLSRVLLKLISNRLQSN